MLDLEISSGFKFQLSPTIRHIALNELQNKLVCSSENAEFLFQLKGQVYY